MKYITGNHSDNRLGDEHRQTVPLVVGHYHHRPECCFVDGVGAGAGDLRVSVEEDSLLPAQAGIVR